MQLKLHFHLSIRASGGEYLIDVWGKPENLKTPGDPEKAAGELITWYHEQRAVTLKLLEQVHGDTLIETGAGDNACWGRADAAFSRTSSDAVAIKTADCIPLLFFHTGRLFFGGIHAGWRGLHNGIIEKSFQKLFGPDREGPLKKAGNEPRKGELLLFCGPFISTARYEVGPEVYENFNEECLENLPEKNKKLLNMNKILYRQLDSSSALPERVLLQMDACTRSDPRFFSHRGGDLGRNFTVISFSKNR